MMLAVAILDPDLVALLKPVFDLAHGRSLVVPPPTGLKYAYMA